MTNQSKPIELSESEYDLFIKQLSKVTDPQFQKDLIRVVNESFTDLKLDEDNPSPG
jgi:hypothetical protein